MLGGQPDWPLDREGISPIREAVARTRTPLFSKGVASGRIGGGSGENEGASFPRIKNYATSETLILLGFSTVRAVVAVEVLSAAYECVDSTWCRFRRPSERMIDAIGVVFLRRFVLHVDADFI